MPPGAGTRRPPASPASAPQPTRQSNAAASTRPPPNGTAKRPVALLIPPPSSPPRRLVRGLRGKKRAAPNGVREGGQGGGKKAKKRRTASSSDDGDSDGDSDADGSDEESKDNGGTPSRRNGDTQQLPRRYTIKPQASPPAPSAKSNKAVNTLHNYFATAASSSPSSPPSSSSSPASSDSSHRSSSPGVPSDVAAVLGAVSPHDANVARQASAMKRIARLHAQLQSDMTWDPGKREGKEEKKEADEAKFEYVTDSPAARTPAAAQRKGRPPPLNPSLIQTPPFRLLPDNTARSGSAPPPTKPKHAKTTPAARRSAASSTAPSAVSDLSPTPSSLPTAVFLRRHLPLARAERRMRAEQRRESTENWIICDACSKWRLLPQPARATQPDQPVPAHYHCGGHATASPAECERLDDWIVRCVGEGRAVLLCDVGVDTVEVLVGASGKRRRDSERAMERLGMEFDSTTQRIKCFSVTQ